MNPSRFSRGAIFLCVSVLFWFKIQEMSPGNDRAVATAIVSLLAIQAILSWIGWKWTRISGLNLGITLLTTVLFGELAWSSRISLVGFGLVCIVWNAPALSEPEEEPSGTHPLDDDRHRHPIEKDRGEQHDRAQSGDH